MSLRYELLSFINRVRRQPADGSDPRLLARLEKLAQEAWDGAFVALTAPCSPQTWETVSILRGSSLSGPRVPFSFPRPVEIVGFYPTVIPLDPTEDTLTIPTLDTIACAIDTDNQNYVTAGDGLSTEAGGTAGPFVTLSALSVQVPRVLGYKLRNPTPNIGFTFRWKLAVPQAPASPVFADCLISMGIYARYIA